MKFGWSQSPVFVQFIILFVINEYFDLKFAVYLAIASHYDVLKGLFDSAVVLSVVVVGARSWG